MAFDVTLEDELGNAIDRLGDDDNLLPKLLPSPDDSSYHCLRFVDKYGHTVFNRAQARVILSELDKIRQLARSSQELALLGRLENLARRCANEPHLYLKFYGD
jgi:hypothetical protein